jgi:uncharacterized protein (TIGR03084 family)
VTETSNVIADLVAEGDKLDKLVADLDEARWATATPAPGWTVAHQIAHLAATFRLAGLAAARPEVFSSIVSGLSADFNANVTAAMAEYVVEPPARLLARWRQERATTEAALAALPGDQIVPWLVRPIPAAVLAAAGFTELFAHGQDVADAIGVRREYTDSLVHLVGFVVRTWDFGYQARGLAVPDVQFGYEITAPSGAVWRFGPPDAAQRIVGPALDLCLLATRRRHRDDLAVRAFGAEADRWLDLAQAYRGPAGAGRAPGQFAALST